MEVHDQSVVELLERYPSKNHGDSTISDLERLEIIIHKLKFIPAEHRAQVTYLQAITPVSITADDYLDRLIRIAGGIPTTDPSAADFNPNVLIVISDRSVGQLLSDLPEALSTTFWSETDAVRNHNVYVVHHPQYLRHSGNHPADDAEILAEIINPGYFVYGREGDAWMRFT